MTDKQYSNIDAIQLVRSIKTWAKQLGFQGAGISDTSLQNAEIRLMEWLGKSYHGKMNYMQHHGSKRTRPQELEKGTLSIISVRMDYLPQNMEQALAVLNEKQNAYISRYALGRDYHKVLRRRLARLARKIEEAIGPFSYRVFTDSAPVMEKALAEKAGLGWIGKHSNLIDQNAGSWFFIGEIYTDLPLPSDTTAPNHCGTCTQCIQSCPTEAIIAPYTVDARRCISYLTIELKDSIPLEFRKAMGNRIYGCDDCQLFCPWNRFVQISPEKDFAPRHELDHSKLTELFSWTENQFLNQFEGSAIRRIGYECWLRNIAVALGNCGDMAAKQALETRKNHPSEMVREHVQWALQQINNT